MRKVILIIVAAAMLQVGAVAQVQNRQKSLEKLQLTQQVGAAVLGTDERGFVGKKSYNALISRGFLGDKDLNYIYESGVYQQITAGLNWDSLHYPPEKGKKRNGMLEVVFDTVLKEGIQRYTSSKGVYSRRYWRYPEAEGLSEWWIGWDDWKPLYNAALEKIRVIDCKKEPRLHPSRYEGRHNEIVYEYWPHDKLNVPGFTIYSGMVKTVCRWHAKNNAMKRNQSYQLLTKYNGEMWKRETADDSTWAAWVKIPDATDLAAYQPVVSDTLNTLDKTVVGAINENNALIKNKVSSVNGETPDENGNITIATGGGELEKITENGKTGWRLKGANPDHHGNIGTNAIDLSTSQQNSTTAGAIGYYSFAAGLDVSADGYCSVAIGRNTVTDYDYATAIGLNSRAHNGSVAIGYHATASPGQYATAIGTSVKAGMRSVVIGYHSNANKQYAVALGSYATVSNDGEICVGSYNTIAPSSERRRFTVGNGLGYQNRSDAMIILKSGLTTLPSQTIQMQDGEPTGKVVVTKEYMQTKIDALIAEINALKTRIEALEAHH